LGGIAFSRCFGRANLSERLGFISAAALWETGDSLGERQQYSLTLKNSVQEGCFFSLQFYGEFPIWRNRKTFSLKMNCLGMGNDFVGGPLSVDIKGDLCALKKARV
jgi:hypothetical protein